mmetsp:Transcript_54816/g.91355  ORF Transcript_54816/g.91355 Transcript_54816/m.91355 type:complete len:241 (+) Transcript_54816:1043-1765(+)
MLGQPLDEFLCACLRRRGDLRRIQHVLQVQVRYAGGGRLGARRLGLIGGRRGGAGNGPTKALQDALQRLQFHTAAAGSRRRGRRGRSGAPGRRSSSARTTGKVRQQPHELVAVQLAQHARGTAGAPSTAGGFLPPACGAVAAPQRWRVVDELVDLLTVLLVLVLLWFLDPVENLTVGPLKIQQIHTPCGALLNTRKHCFIRKDHQVLLHGPGVAVFPLEMDEHIVSHGQRDQPLPLVRLH